VTTHGIEHIYLETHDRERSVAFWQALGFKLDFETDHRSGLLVGANGTRVFLAEQPVEDPVGLDIYLGVADAGARTPDLPVEVVRPFTATHWGTRVMTVRDPDEGSSVSRRPPAPTELARRALDGCSAPP
jgi:catechol 2,3-dioxygenase-like lactoylglutathione lyase family enzyme